MNDSFDIDYWLQQGESAKPAEKPSTPLTHTHDTDDFQIVADRIAARRIDITGDYAQWRDLGFAISHELGEAGREIYHQISQFYPGYSRGETDDQYTACLKGHGSNIITGRTFFKLAKDHGIDIATAQPRFRNSVDSARTESTESADSSPEQGADFPAPSFSDEVFFGLPVFLQKVASKADNPKEADILILGTIACISAVLPNYYAIYDEMTIYANLCYYLTARASSGKGRLALCRYLLKPIHDELRSEFKNLKAQYDSDMIQFDRDKRDKKKTGIVRPEKPKQKMLLIPGNTSATAVTQIMHDNDGTGVIFETEGDVLASSFKSDYGDYSENFRSAFHHEPFGFHRRGDDEHVEVEVPKLSAVLSGTPEQIKTLIRTPENGLFSRFAFYYLESNLEFKNVFHRSAGPSLNAYFAELGNEYQTFYHALKDLPHQLEFSLTEAQQAEFLDFFSENQTELFIDFGDGILATVRRLAVICFRIAMVLSGLRLMESGNLYEDVVCTDTDFSTAMTISRALLKHSTKVFCELFGEKQQKRLSSSAEQNLFDALPADFGRQDYIAAAKKLGINERTAEGYVAKFCGKMGLVERQGYGKYHKKTQQQ